MSDSVLLAMVLRLPRICWYTCFWIPAYLIIDGRLEQIKLVIVLRFLKIYPSVRNFAVVHSLNCCSSIHSAGFHTSCQHRSGGTTHWCILALFSQSVPSQLIVQRKPTGRGWQRRTIGTSKENSKASKIVWRKYFRKIDTVSVISEMWVCMLTTKCAELLKHVAWQQSHSCAPLGYVVSQFYDPLCCFHHSILRRYNQTSLILRSFAL
jgi:hypothetical protein